MYKNNIGFLRLFLAISVIISHSPEMIDGNREREYFTMLFGTMSLGDFAVECFFIISGYLITMSYENSTTFKSFILKRVLRIYPAFIFATCFCFLIVLPLSASFSYMLNLELLFWIKNIIRALFLQIPWTIDGVFETVPIPFFNSPSWTIRYEFLCYLLVPVIVYFLKSSLVKYITVMVSLFYISYFFTTNDISYSVPLDVFQFTSDKVLRLLTPFLAGSAFYKFRDRIVFKRIYLVISLVFFTTMMFYPCVATIGLSTFGAYVLFYFAFKYQNSFISSIGTKVDLSYGMYLFAWPIQNLLIQYDSNITSISLSIYTLFISSLLALISWTFIEKPCLQLKNKFRQ